jgi:hypothetical protein
VRLDALSPAGTVAGRGAIRRIAVSRLPAVLSSGG